MKVKVTSFIFDKNWSLPQNLLPVYPDIMKNISNDIIPSKDKLDSKIWNHLETGILSLKLPYNFCHGH